MYLFNDNIYKGNIDIRYLFNRIAFNGVSFNEDYYIENIKSEFNKLSNNLVKAYTKDISYMVAYINNGEKLEEKPINLKDVREKFVAYSGNLPFGISKLSYINLKKRKIVSSVIFDDKYKILKTESLKMPLFLGFLRNSFTIHFNVNSLEEELLEYIELNRNKMQYVLIDEFKKWLKELREVRDQVRMIRGELQKQKDILKSKKEGKIDFLEWM